jgi:hypothetical protein
VTDTATEAKYKIAQEVARELGVVLSVLVVLLYDNSDNIVSAKETKVSPEDQGYTMPSHTR